MYWCLVFVSKLFISSSGFFYNILHSQNKKIQFIANGFFPKPSSRIDKKTTASKEINSRYIYWKIPLRPDTYLRVAKANRSYGFGTADTKIRNASFGNVLYLWPFDDKYCTITFPSRAFLSFRKKTRNVKTKNTLLSHLMILLYPIYVFRVGLLYRYIRKEQAGCFGTL